MSLARREHDGVSANRCMCMLLTCTDCGRLLSGSRVCRCSSKKSLHEGLKAVTREVLPPVDTSLTRPRVYRSTRKKSKHSNNSLD